MANSLFNSVVDSRVQLRRYHYIRNVTAFGFGLIAALAFDNSALAILAFISVTALSWFTVSRLIAFLACLIEQLAG